MKNLLLNQFELHHRLFNNVLEGFTDEETNQRLSGYPEMNHVKYLAGHLLNSQYGLTEIAGVNVEVKWNELFAPAGQSEAKDNFKYPTINSIKNEWNNIHEPTFHGLKKLTAKDLEAKSPYDFWETTGEMWSFLNHHQAYHIGQIGILRRGFGKEPMSYE